MNILSIAFEAIAGVLGGLVVAAALTWLGWTAFKVVRHPEWGPPAVIILLVTILGGALRSNEFMRTVLLFSVIAGIIVWFEGSGWRSRHPRREQDPKPKTRPSANVRTLGSKRGANQRSEIT